MAKANGKKRQSPSVERKLALALVALLEDISLIHIGEVVSATENSDRAAREVLKANGYEDLESIPRRVARIEAEMKAALEAHDGTKLGQLGPALERAKKGLPPLPTEKKTRAPRKAKTPKPEAAEKKSRKKKGGDELPPHLKDDAPFAQCTKCGRKTFTASEFGAKCGLTQPNNQKCDGTFEFAEVEAANA